MPPVSAQVTTAAPRTAPRRGRWLFAVLMFAIGLVPATAIAKAVGPTQPACPGLQKRQSRTRALPEFGLSRLDQKLETEIDPVSERLRCR